MKPTQPGDSSADGVPADPTWEYVRRLAARPDSWQAMGASPLHASVAREDTSGVRSLLEAGADVRAATDEHGLSPLHIAAATGNGEIAELLAARGADINLRDARGRTPLCIAALTDRGALAAWSLVEHGADLDAADEDGLTALEHALARDRLALVQLLLVYGATIQSPGIQVPCPQTRCGGTVDVPVAAASLAPRLSWWPRLATCNSCGQTFGCLAGVVRSVSGRVVERGLDIKEWRVRHFEMLDRSREHLLTFLGPRDIEAKGKDEFICLCSPEERRTVLFYNAKLGVSWRIPSYRAAGCCGAGAVALLAGGAVIISAVSRLW
jgi:hypothetical protein